MVVVDVKFRIRVRLACCLKCDADKVFTEYLSEDAVAKSAILVEYLVDNILNKLD